MILDLFEIRFKYSWGRDGESRIFVVAKNYDEAEWVSRGYLNEGEKITAINKNGILYVPDAQGIGDAFQK